MAGAVAGSALIAPVSAHMGPFPHLRKHFLTKKAADARYVKKGQTVANAETIDGLDSTAFVVNSGLVLVNASWLGWVELDGEANDAQTVVEYRADRALLHGDAPGQKAALEVQIPTAIYGRALRLLGAEVCYDATEAGGPIDRVDLAVHRQSAGVGGATPEASVADTTNRTDEACRDLMLPAPLTFSSADVVILTVEADFTMPSKVGLGRVALILEPTSASAVVP